MPPDIFKLFGKKKKLLNVTYVLSNEKYSLMDIGMDFGNLIKQCNFRAINRKIILENFPEINTVIENYDNYDYLLIRFKRELSSKKLTRIFDQLELCPANVRELVCFFMMLRSRLQRRILKFDIIALSSSWEDSKNKIKQRIPFINSKRKLRLSHGTNFTNGDIFLVKRLKK